MNSHLQKATSVASWDSRNRHFMSTSVIYEFNYFESTPHMNFIFFYGTAVSSCLMHWLDIAVVP